MEQENRLDEIKRCTSTFFVAVNDTIAVINGKWKLPIIGSMIFGKKRFKEMEREIPRITPRMLSKELKELEINGIITRTVHNTIPVIVEYELTKSGHDLNRVLDVMLDWGLQHRERVLGTGE